MEEEAVAVLVMVPGALPFRTRLIVCDDDTAIALNVQVTGPVPTQLAIGVTETKVAGPIQLSVTVTFVTEGPLLVTFTVYVAFWPSRIDDGPVFVSATSVCGTATSVTAVPLGGFGSSLITPFA